MSRKNAFSKLRKLVVSTALCAIAAASANAAPVKFEAVISPKAESRLTFADGSKRYFLATQREGTVAGDGLLSGATMLEWGTHDVTPGSGAHGNGYLVFTTAEGDIAYFKYQFRALQIAVAEGKRRILINGHWEVVGGTGKFQGLRGAGTLQVKPLSPKERRWILEGELL
jgi:hypothetical protein